MRAAGKTLRAVGRTARRVALRCAARSLPARAAAAGASAAAPLAASGSAAEQMQHLRGTSSPSTPAPAPGKSTCAGTSRRPCWPPPRVFGPAGAAGGVLGMRPSLAGTLRGAHASARGSGRRQAAMPCATPVPNAAALAPAPRRRGRTRWGPRREAPAVSNRCYAAMWSVVCDAPGWGSATSGVDDLGLGALFSGWGRAKRRQPTQLCQAAHLRQAPRQRARPCGTLPSNVVSTVWGAATGPRAHQQCIFISTGYLRRSFDAHLRCPGAAVCPGSLRNLCLAARTHSRGPCIG